MTAPEKSTTYSQWTACVAPMLDWTDRHCRYFHRLLSQHTRLYTEMVHTGAILHGQRQRFLQFNEEEHPLALQLGGSEPADLARCAQLAQEAGYDEVNLNCGCPSERVQRGSFGACLMAEPALVSDCVKAMVDACSIPVTVKHRIGLDQQQSYGPLRDFVGQVAEAGCRVFIVHARNAWLKGLSPKENREIPPLRYEVVRQLKADFPQLGIVVNGGIATLAQMQAHLQGAEGQRLDGVMVGREAYHNPWFLTQWDAALFGSPPSALQRDAIEEEMVRYMARQQAAGVSPLQIARHMLGLRNGQPGAKAWRQVWSDHRLKELPAPAIAAQARQARLRNAAGIAHSEAGVTGS
ncbi:tRNA dihydrouridine(20/20a) synthase DusA [Vandammella animalimorsus]|uniref:tRNA-dihydrouridine(20/20a) synthase n=1 Tax=Vandammella animalimorsus TaxID=2029117 RepID=A0A2A2AS19_9BURK|nr:tRNA dihydrouridine(20/20a) synthase DusA [Vandammella animalimorsus]PAT40553.1 tRNA dihydrouridine(20/20a) synthase DusA [Vandammella animalimorsus]